MQTIGLVWLALLVVGGVFVVLAVALGRAAGDADAQTGRDAAELRALLAVALQAEVDADPSRPRDPWLQDEPMMLPTDVADALDLGKSRPRFLRETDGVPQVPDPATRRLHRR